MCIRFVNVCLVAAASAVWLSAGAMSLQAADTPTPAAAPSADAESAPDTSVAEVTKLVKDAVCRITVENAWGIPVAVTDGFLMGTGTFVVTNLGQVALDGAARVRVEFATGGPILATQFGLADASLGIVVIRLDGKGAGRPGLALATTLPPLEEMGPVATAQVDGEGEVHLTGVRVQKGPAISRAVAPVVQPTEPDPFATDSDPFGTATEPAPSDEPPATPPADPKPGAAEPAEEGADEADGGRHFFRIDRGDTDRGPGLPIVDRNGRVVAVVSDMVPRESVLVGVPGPALHEALLGAEPVLRDVEGLPKPRWTSRVVRLRGHMPTLEDFSQAIVSAKTRMVCPMCGGRGVLPPDDGSTPAGRRPISRGGYMPRCAACYGDGIVVEAGLMKILGSIAERGARIVWSPDTDGRNRQAARQGILDVLRSLATAPARPRQLFATYAGREVARAVRKTPAGVMVYAQVREVTDGPDGKYLLLEPWQASTTIAVRLSDLVATPQTAGATPNYPPVGSWTYIAGVVLSRFESDTEDGVYILPAVLIPAPTTTR